MSFDMEMNRLIQKYLSEEGQELTLEEIAERPHWKRVWFWWKAKERYEGFEIKMTMEECEDAYGK